VAESGPASEGESSSSEELEQAVRTRGETKRRGEERKRAATREEGMG
jgi:hypothetical protein